MNAVMAGVVGYIALQFLIGALVSRHISTESDYIVAGRRIGPVLGAFTVFATWFGAEVIVGTSGEVYAHGLKGAQFDPFGYAVALLLSGIVVAAALWRQDITTFADFFRKRFGPTAERMVVVLLVPGSLFWAAAQIRAFGQIVGSVAAIDVTVAITLAAIVVAAYTILGGLMADAITDLVQGIAVMIGLGVLVVLTAGALGGFEASFAAVPPERFEVLGGSDKSWLEAIEAWLVPICGTMVAIELVSRMLGCRSAEVARRATVAGAGLYLVVGLLPIYLGLVAPLLMPGLGEDQLEQVVPELAQKLMPGLLYVIFAGAIISAILSTVDSTLVAAASLVSHNVVVRYLPNPTERARLVSVRISVAVMAVGAYLLAMKAASVRDLVETAAAFGSSGVVVCLLLGLFTRFGEERSAIAALAAGVVVWVGGVLSQVTSTPYLFACVAALVAYVAAATLSSAPSTPTQVS
ncbi:MAG: sodium:solute symporter family protein [Hyphomicrobiaceae bacterium]|nr:sodium:solute symporter family protein [Hyphomicrobiaceae bacterium]